MSLKRKICMLVIGCTLLNAINNVFADTNSTKDSVWSKDIQKSSDYIYSMIEEKIKEQEEIERQKQEELQRQETEKAEKERQKKMKNAYLGKFKITGYTPSPSENGGYSVTAMGDNLYSSVGYAIATDPNVIHLGTKVYIEGIGYRTARDTGGAIKGNKIDVLTASNSESYAITGYYDVYLAE